MHLNTLNFYSKLGISGFLITLIFGVLSAATLVGLLYSSFDSGFNVPEIAKVKAKYSESLLVSAMKTSMYQHVTTDEDIDLVDKWIKNGALKNDYFRGEVMYIIEADCQKCHSRTSTMTGAIPSIPLSTYEDILVFSEKGYSWKAMAKTAHIHLLGIALVLALLTLIFSISQYLGIIKGALISAAWLSLWLDISAWWLAKFSSSFAYLIAIAGSIEIMTIIIMSLLSLVNLWLVIPKCLREKKQHN